MYIKEFNVQEVVVVVALCNGYLFCGSRRKQNRCAKRLYRNGRSHRYMYTATVKHGRRGKLECVRVQRGAHRQRTERAPEVKRHKRRATSTEKRTRHVDSRRGERSVGRRAVITDGADGYVRGAGHSHVVMIQRFQGMCRHGELYGFGSAACHRGHRRRAAGREEFS